MEGTIVEEVTRCHATIREVTCWLGDDPPPRIVRDKMCIKAY